jgi:hypothetical protein
MAEFAATGRGRLDRPHPRRRGIGLHPGRLALANLRGAEQGSVPRCARQNRRNGARRQEAFLHLDMHGSVEKGVEIAASKEFVPWSLLVPKLRTINQASGNNLCVVAATCWAFHAIKQVGIKQAVPFFLLVAPAGEVTSGFLQDHIGPFYRQMLKTGDVIASFTDNLSPEMQTFHCGIALARAMAQYISVHCKGNSGKKRRENLLTEVLLAGRPRTQVRLGEIRKSIKAGVTPDQRTLDKFAEIFLVGKPCGFNFDQLSELVEAVSRANMSRQKIAARLPRG